MAYRRERERILGEHLPRDHTLLERRVAERLEQDLEGSPLRGRPLPHRSRNFTVAVVVAFMSFLALAPINHLMPFYMENVQHLHVSETSHARSSSLQLPCLTRRVS